MASQAANLARLGFVRPESVERLQGIGLDPLSLAGAADPDQALAFLAELVDRDPSLRAELSDPVLLQPLVAVLGASRALGEYLVRYPADRRFLCIPPQRVMQMIQVSNPEWEEALNEVRVGYRRLLLSIAALDLTGQWGMPEVTKALSQAADLVLQAALKIAQRVHSHDSDVVDLAVIAMGKCGGNELNYISDVDVIFVAEPKAGHSLDRAIESGNKLASTLMRVCTDVTSEGSIWPVDAGLRPEGRDGPLVRSVESHLEYYKKWAKTWEFQALLKARYSAGDPLLGKRYLDAVMPLVWTAADRDDFVLDVQQMRRRVEENIPTKEADRQIKLGVGGLRDVEFAVQLLQLVHGKADDTLRTGNTLDALTGLSRGGFVGRDDANALSEAYTWLRELEHRIQLYRLRRTHVLPESEDDLRRLARSLGYIAEPVSELQQDWRAKAALVRQIHEKLFYRPLLLAVARLGAEEQRLTPEAAERRLLALGYQDPQGALTHLHALTDGISRRASIQKTLLPAMLGWFADGPNPDAGLFGFRRISEALGETPWYLRTLRDSGVVAQRLALILSTSRFVTELLLRAPEAVAMLEDDGQLMPRGRDVLVNEARAVAARQTDPASAIEAVRAVRRRELFRTAVADILGLISVEEVGRSLTDVAAATIAAAIDAATLSMDVNASTRFAVIAMGRLGGDEMSYPSDADVLFVHQPVAGADDQEATEYALSIASNIRSLCALPSTEPPLLIDADLRPEGRDGALVRTLDSYAAYYQEWAESWERQALLRAKPIAGDVSLGAAFISMIEMYRYPNESISLSDVREIRRIKARVESERLPRGADPLRHVKLGPGGLSDVEWLAQLLQLRHGGQHAALRHTSTLTVLRAAEELGLLTHDELDDLVKSWTLATRIRNAIMLIRGKPGDELPRDSRDLRAVALLLGFSSAGELIDHWKRVSRRGRACFEKRFFAD